MTHHIQESLNKIISRFLIRNFGGQKAVGQYSQKAKIKSYQPRILYPAKLSFKREGEINTFPDKQKLREYITTRPPLQVMLKGVLSR